MVDTIKFSQMTNAGNINNDDIVPSLRSNENVILNNPWTFLPSGTTAQRPAPSAIINYRLRLNTDTQLYEYYNAVLMVWTQLAESAVTDGPFLTYTADVTLPDAQNLGALSNGILKQNIALGVATIDIAVNGTDFYGPGYTGYINAPAGIADINGNPILNTVSAGALAVNYLRISNNITGNGPSINAAGADTNIALNLTSKGTGPIGLSTEAVNQALFIYNGTGRQHLTRFSFANTAADRVITWPDASGTVAFGGSTVSSLQGTANQVLVNGTSGSPVTGTDIILTTPQDIGTSSAVAFGSVTTTGAIQATGARLFSGAVGGGFAGGIGLYSPTAAMGSLQFVAQDNAGNFGTIVTNALMGQVTTLTIPDPVASAANFILSVGGATQHITAFGLQVDAGSLISGLSTGGSAGRLVLFSPTANLGSLNVLAANNAGNFASFLTNASASAARTWTLPDATGTIALTSDLTGFVSSVSGTANRITSTGGTTPVIDISASYIGQSSITTLGTITTGVWNGTTIAIANGGTGITSFGTGVATALGQNVTGSGGIVLATSPTLITPILGVAAATSINFGGSALNNYTDSTFTPTMTCGSPGDLSVAYANQTGIYTRIGSMVYANIRIQFTPTFTTASGQVQIAGLPFAVQAGNGIGWSGSISFFAGSPTFPVGTTCINVQAESGASFCSLPCFGSAVAGSFLQMSGLVTGVQYHLVFTVAYHV